MLYAKHLFKLAQLTEMCIRNLLIILNNRAKTAENIRGAKRLYFLILSVGS